MTSQKDIAKKQAEIVGQLQQFPIGRTNSGGRAGGTVEVVITNPLPGQPRVVQAKCANDCPPGDVQIIKADDGSYVALSPNAARSTGEKLTRQVSKKNPTAPQKDGEFWPVTSCFLYSRIKPNKEKLTGNGAAQGDETSWDSMRAYSSPNSNSYAYGFAERLDNLGDYATASDALNNILKPDRLIVPTGGANASALRDDAAISSRSQDAVTIWFYLGNPTDALANGQIFSVSGPPFHPAAGNITNGGPGYCMEVYRGGSISSGIFPNEDMGVGPLTKKLKESFPGLGGEIGYAGRIEKWRIQDYIYASNIAYFRNTPTATQTFQTPTDFPSWYVAGQSTSPWQTTGSTWFQFGWPSPQYIGCASTSWINVITSELTGKNCGVAVPNESWYWGGDATPTFARIDRDNPSGYIGTRGMWVCWQGHKDNSGLAQSFFETFKDYWGISGSVTKLGSCNLYGCEIPGGGGYPSPPPSDARRFLIETYGRKAKVFLVCHKQDYEPIEIELPFEYAAVIEEMTVLGGGSLGVGTNFEPGKTRKFIRTYADYVSDHETVGLELVHGTLSIDAEFAYINLFYGGKRIYEEPMNLPVPFRLASQGFGSPLSGSGSNYGSDKTIPRGLGVGSRQYSLEQYSSGYPQTPEQTKEKYVRHVKDCWTCCLAIKVKLPTKDNKTLTIVATQKYKIGEVIALTANNPDNEFDNKFLVRDYRTDDDLSTFKTPNSDFASFGGLPALAQQMFLQFPITLNPYRLFGLSDIPLQGLLYKLTQDRTEMDWVHYQLQEMPRQYNPLVTVLSPGVTTDQYGASKTNMIYDLDGKFGRHARAEKIMPASSFGFSGTYYGGLSPTYSSQGGVGPETLFTSHKEQMIGNGLKENGVLKKWFRVTTSSFPVFGQLLRNNS